MATGNDLKIKNYFSPQVFYGNKDGYLIRRSDYANDDGQEKTRKQLMDDVHYVKCGDTVLSRADRPQIPSTTALVLLLTTRAVIVAIKATLNWFGDTFLGIMQNVSVRFLLEEMLIPSALQSPDRPYILLINVVFLGLNALYNFRRQPREWVEGNPQKSPFIDSRLTFKWLDLIYYFPSSDQAPWIYNLFGNPVLEFPEPQPKFSHEEQKPAMVVVGTPHTMRGEEDDVKGKSGDRNERPANENGKASDKNEQPADGDGKQSDETGQPVDENVKPHDENEKPKDEKKDPAATSDPIPESQEARGSFQQPLEAITPTEEEKLQGSPDWPHKKGDALSPAYEMLHLELNEARRAKSGASMATSRSENLEEAEACGDGDI